MADVAIDPQNSNPKELFGQGVRAYVLQDYDTAIRALSKASEILSAEHGNETHDSLGDVYLYYGKSLLELSRREGGALGEAVLKNVEEESGSEEVEDADEGEDNVENDVKAEGDDVNKTDDEKTKQAKVDEKVGDGEKKEKVTAEEASKEEEKREKQTAEEERKGEEKKDDETSEVEKEKDDKKEGEENEDDLTDLQVAWEVLELAKSIFTKRGADGKKNLAETLIVLGEISLESGNFTSAIEDMNQGLEIQKSLFGNDSRTIAESYYKLGGAYSMNAQIDEAIESFHNSYEYLQNKVNSLKKEEEHKEANIEEIEELNNLIPEIQEKIVDMKSLKTEIANKVTTSVDETAPKTNGTSEPSSSKQVNNISHLVKRKRKEEAQQEEKPAKRPSP